MNSERPSLQVLRDVRIIIAEQLGVDVETIPPDVNFADIGADSLDTVEIMMALEEKFDLELDEEGMNRKEPSTLDLFATAYDCHPVLLLSNCQSPGTTGAEQVRTVQDAVELLVKQIDSK
jgi:acyl carrier protein